jgi:peptidase E
MGGLRGPDVTAGPGAGWAASVPPLVAYAADLSGREVPRICVLNTAAGDDPAGFVKLYSGLSGLPSMVSHLQLFPMPNVADPAGLLLSQDVIFVGGGSVANLMAVWRVHGLDQIMRQAWEAGIVLSGVSAGAICWFAGGTTDSFGPLRPFTDGLRLLAGSYCPHYDSEPGRRPLYRELVASEALPAGLACDDGAAAHFIDDTLAEIVTDRPEAGGYLVARDDAGAVTETNLATRFLGS